MKAELDLVASASVSRAVQAYIDGLPDASAALEEAMTAAPDLDDMQRALQMGTIVGQAMREHRAHMLAAMHEDLIGRA